MNKQTKQKENELKYSLPYAFMEDAIRHNIGR